MIDTKKQPDRITRRKFIRNAGIAAGAGIALSIPFTTRAGNFLRVQEPVTVRQIMDKFIAEVGAGNLPDTVDTLKSGSADTVVSGVQTTMFTTIDMIRKAIALGANFIIAHEPSFFFFLVFFDWLKNDDVYQYKADLLKQHNITVWRNHDYIHRHKPDGVIKAQLEQLEWAQYSDSDMPNLLTMPSTPLITMVQHVKSKLKAVSVRYNGDLQQTCRRVLFMTGAPGGERQIEALMKLKPNVFFCGELSEWESAEYVRDARARGDNLSLVVLGHIASEEWGSQFMLEWMNKNLPAIKTTHISPGNSLKFM